MFTVYDYFTLYVTNNFNSYQNVYNVDTCLYYRTIILLTLFFCFQNEPQQSDSVSPCIYIYNYYCCFSFWFFADFSLLNVAWHRPLFLIQIHLEPPLYM